MAEAFDIHINGIVQGVGFRPFVARLARSLELRGWVRNSTHGVDIRAWGEGTALEQFAEHLRLDAPPAAMIVSLEATAIDAAGEAAPEDFKIVTSEADASRDTLVSPDLATCPDCLAELFNPMDKRYRYPFINCTNCGPRFTIINDLPYDRPATSMAGFTMCPSCAGEYGDESDRRYHAQPDACFECGPMLRGGVTPFERTATTREESDALITEAQRRLLAGEVLGIKGLGGWHLACDATNAAAVQALRDRKRRPSKPLAVMVANIEAAERYCEVSAEEAALLESPAHPIVLMPRVEGAGAKAIAANVAGDLPELGLMLPSTPVQHLIICDLDIPLVMTSGNRSGEPIVAADSAIEDTLGDICDWYLGNNRNIVARYDDSVARVLADGSTQVVRRARGYAPAPLFVPAAEGGGHDAAGSVEPQASETYRAAQGAAPTRTCDVPGSSEQSTAAGEIRRGRILSDPPSAGSGGQLGAMPVRGSGACIPGDGSPLPVIFAAGPQQKSTFCFLAGERAYLSQHLGDLETLGAWNAWEEARERYGRLFGLAVRVLACDKHPEYLSSKWAREQARSQGLPLVEVQHHHAHIASVMGECGLVGPVIGVALDGTGYGEDKTIWGCEVMLATRASFERLWHLPVFGLPGGSAAVRDPRRSAYALLVAAGLEDDERFTPFLDALPQRKLMAQMLAKRLNTPLCSSAGRLFDAAAALMGLVTTAGYDGEGACLLEARARQELAADGYTTLLGSAPTVPNDASDAELFAWLLTGGMDAPLAASGLHRRLAAVIIEQCERARAQSGVGKVALGGGCMVNRLLLGLLKQGLADRGFEVYANRELPPNDGCIAYGQAIVAAARLMEV